MIDVRWSRRTYADIRRISDHWVERDPRKVRVVIGAIRQRVNWIADGHTEVGSPVKGMPANYHWYLERTYGYKIFYRAEGSPPTGIAVITVRHVRQRPLSPSTLRKYVR